MTTSLQNLWCFRTVSVPDSMFQNVCSTLSTHYVLSRESKKIITNNSNPISQGEAKSQNNISVSYSWGAWAKFRTQARVTPAARCSSQYCTASHRAPEIEWESPVWLIVFLTTKSSEKSLAWKLGRVTTHQPSLQRQNFSYAIHWETWGHWDTCSHTELNILGTFDKVGMAWESPDSASHSTYS